MSTYQIATTCQVRVTSTSSGTICCLELHLNRFYRPVARITRTHTDHGRCRSIHKNGTFCRLKRKRDCERCRQRIPKRSMETSRITYGNHFPYGRKIPRRILGVTLQNAGYYEKDVDSLSPSD